MFKFVSNIKKWWLVQAFRSAYTVALESRSDRERLATANYALEIVNKIVPWSIHEVPRRRAIGKLHGSLARTYSNLLHENPLRFSQLAIEESFNSLKYLIPEDGIEWALTMNNLSIIYAENPIGSREENLEKAIRTAEAVLIIIESGDDPMWFKVMANLGGYYNERQLGDPQRNVQKSIRIFEEILQKLDKDLPTVERMGIMVSLATSYSKVLGYDRQQKMEKAIDILEAPC